MSEAMEKVFGMRQFPLFPLPLVLLPGEMLPLHIFEPRYRQMLKDVVEFSRNMFGVTYFDAAATSEGRPAIGSIGCAAEIREKQALPDGRSNIATFGIVRYRLFEYAESDAPYFVGKVDFFEDEPEDEAEVNLVTSEVYELFERVARAAFRLSGNRGNFPEIPNSGPEQLSFLVCAAFKLDDELKYKMLEMTSTIRRLAEL
ncbi:MAG: LON peptidase substrate-binding domain-containing protein [Acidobacteria bacterium]|nr:LON peptidase substrate-binding domain-containing protein [Acidobacteriota bacterium]